MIALRKTSNRRHPIYLRAEHDDAGPYYLTDQAGYGVWWSKPKQHGHIGRSPTWVPVFRRAVLAFQMLDRDETITPSEAKKAIDKVFDSSWYRVGDASSGEDVLGHAFAIVDTAKRKP